MGDYELWQAMHTDCPKEGSTCCVLIEDVEITDLVTRAASAAGMPVDAFIHMALSERLSQIGS